MLPGEHEFFRAMFEDPGDWPRLVYADWLEDHGEIERAEFVRVQCRLSTMGPDEPRRRELEVREDELRPYYERALQPWLLHAFPDMLLSWRAERGIPHISFSDREFQSIAHKLREPFPWIGITLIWSAADLEEMVGLPMLERVVSVSFFYRDFRRESMRTLLSALDRAYLYDLSLGHSKNLRPSVMQQLANWPGLSRVRRLSFSFSELTDKEIGVLVGSGYLSNLRWLQLNNNGLTDIAPRSLASSPGIGTLRWIGLTGCDQVTRQGVEVLAGSDLLPSLEVINFGSRCFDLPAPPSVEFLRVKNRRVALVPDGAEGHWWGEWWDW